jgi:hypothetical protein
MVAGVEADATAAAGVDALAAAVDQGAAMAVVVATAAESALSQHPAPQQNPVTERPAGFFVITGTQAQE